MDRLTEIHGILWRMTSNLFTKQWTTTVKLTNFERFKPSSSFRRNHNLLTTAALACCSDVESTIMSMLFERAIESDSAHTSTVLLLYVQFVCLHIITVIKAELRSNLL